MRINNPGNLRFAVGPDFRTKLVDGLASFATLEQGTRSLLYCIYQYYGPLARTSLRDFVAVFADKGNTDLIAYEMTMVIRLGLNPLKTKTADLKLNQPWRALDFARALIHAEQGVVTIGHGESEEWVPPTVMLEAMRNSMKWRAL